jgi:DNA-binding NtrC family response regulator
MKSGAERATISGWTTRWFRRSTSWPGNVREVENAIVWAISMGATPYIFSEDLPKEIQCRDSDGPSEGSYQQKFVAFQKDLFERTVRECGGNQSEAARRLDLHPTTFRRRCGELGVGREDEK